MCKYSLQCTHKLRLQNNLIEANDSAWSRISRGALGGVGEKSTCVVHFLSKSHPLIYYYYPPPNLDGSRRPLQRILNLPVTTCSQQYQWVDLEFTTEIIVLLFYSRLRLRFSLEVGTKKHTWQLNHVYYYLFMFPNIHDLTATYDLQKHVTVKMCMLQNVWYTWFNCRLCFSFRPQVKIWTSSSAEKNPQIIGLVTITSHLAQTEAAIYEWIPWSGQESLLIYLPHSGSTQGSTPLEQVVCRLECSLTIKISSQFFIPCLLWFSITHTI